MARDPARGGLLLAGAAAGIAAGVVATVVQLLAWAIDGQSVQSQLLRDVRLTAAIVLGEPVLPPPASFDPYVFGVATIVHFALSIAYGLLLGALIRRTPLAPSVVAGAVFGLALYFVNLHGFTALFPWFAEVRTWDTALGHVVFGVVAAAVFRVTRSTARPPTTRWPAR